ncbi:MRX8 MIOREX complex component 8 [Candida maltosa Xu316]
MIKPHRLVLCRNYSSVDYLVSSVKTPKIAAYKKPDSTTAKTKQRIAARTKINQANKYIITPLQLNKTFSTEDFELITNNQLAEGQNFFKNANVELAWTLIDYEEIPDVKYEILKATIETTLLSKKTFGIAPNLLRPLPEVLFMGHTNVGKSSLINNLLIGKTHINRSSQIAYVSQREGYTKTLNCFTISNKLRIVDSPGYGEHGEEKQGEMVMEYISRRTQLKKVYLLVDSMVGFREEDESILETLIEQGVPFDIVMTKFDKVVEKFFPSNLWKKPNATELIKKSNELVVTHYDKVIRDSGLLDIAVRPKFIFNNAKVTQFIPETLGIKILKADILNSCFAKF